MTPERRARGVAELESIARSIEQHHTLPKNCGLDVIRRIVETTDIGSTTSDDVVRAVEWHREQHGCARVHFWVTLRARFPNLYRPGLLSCYFCGVVKPSDPKYIKACRGTVKITTRWENGR